MFNTQSAGVGEYRQWMPGKALTKAGVNTWMNEGSDLAVALEDLDSFLLEKSTWADVFHVGLVASSNVMLKFASARVYAQKVLNRNIPIIIDCDDDFLHVPTYNVAFKHYGASKEALRLAGLALNVADCVTVTKPILASLYDSYNYNFSVLPNCIDPESWNNPTGSNKTTDVRIVFAGGIGRKNDLDEIRPALESVMRQRPNVRLFFMAIMPDWVQEQWCTDATDPTKNRAFFINSTNHKTYKQIMQWMDFDICLAPVVKNDFNRSKSNIKVLESGLYGAAAVCTDWDTYNDVPGEVVLKAETTYEWTESLLALIDDKTLRQRKASLCKQWALDSFNIHSNVDKWIKCYNESLSRPVIDDEGNGIKSRSLAGVEDAYRECVNRNGQTGSV